MMRAAIVACRRVWIRSTRPALLRTEGGSSAVELALLLPVFLTFALGIVEFGRAFWIQSELQSAVEAAARCRAVNTNTCSSTSTTQSYAAAQMAGMTVATADFTVTTPACGTQVSGTVPFSFIVPGLFPWSVTLTAKSCHP